MIWITTVSLCPEALPHLSWLSPPREGTGNAWDHSQHHRLGKPWDGVWGGHAPGKILGQPKSLIFHWKHPSCFPRFPLPRAHFRVLGRQTSHRTGSPGKGKPVSRFSRPQSSGQLFSLADRAPMPTAASQSESPHLATGFGLSILGWVSQSPRLPQGSKPVAAQPSPTQDQNARDLERCSLCSLTARATPDPASSSVYLNDWPLRP